MLIIQFNRLEKKAFEEVFDKELYDENFIESRRLDGDEIILQAIITTVSIAAPFIIQFYIDQKKKNKEIKIIKKGMEITFKNEKELKKFLHKYK